MIRRFIGIPFIKNRRYLHNTGIRKINPLIPIDPSEIINDEENDEEKIKENKIKRKLRKKDGQSEEDQRKEKREENWDRFKSILSKCFETSLITFSSLLILVLGGYAYHKIYKINVLTKIEKSFEDSNDDNLLLKKNHNLSKSKIKNFWAERDQQELLDEIVDGRIKGRYFLVVGEKGTGKTSAVIESINRIDGKDIAIIDCSSDLELMRLRIGASLNFEYHEDYIGSLFSMKGPRDTTAILDIERAFSKLEEIVIKRNKKNITKPLILIFNNAHLIDNSVDGLTLVELLQQKAESFASSGLLTMIFISDNYWLYEKFKTLSTRLQVINFKDVNKTAAINILKLARLKHFNKEVSDEDCKEIYKLIGGRPQYLNRVASHLDIFKAAHKIIDSEKIWFLTQCGLLGSDMDDDVLNDGKFSISAMLLMRELVEMDRKRLKKLRESEKSSQELNKIAYYHELPGLPLWRARQIMTRPDFIEKYDQLNIFAIDTESNVRADSVPMMRAFHEIASQPDFDELLSDSIDRISEIESILRTRELVMKDLVLGGNYKITKDNSCAKVQLEGGTREMFEIENEDNSNKPYKMMELHEGDRKKWWKKRMQSYDKTYYAGVKTGEEKDKDENEYDISRVVDGSS